MLLANSRPTDRITKLIIIGQVSAYFGLLILTLRHMWIYPAQNYLAVAAIMLAGFLPSAIYRFSSGKHQPYILVVNALFLVSMVYTLLQEWALAGVFILVPVFSLLFQDQTIYLFASLSSLVLTVVLSALYLFDGNNTDLQTVILLDVMTVFLILVFIIHFVVKDIRWRSTQETRHYQTILTLSQSVEVRDPYTQGHSQRVAFLAQLMAGKIPGLDPQLVFNCGLIHDVGKLSISDTILLKTIRLTDDEYEIMKAHTTIGAKLCENLDVSEEIVKGVLHHHERYDGKGYPHGLKGGEIPLIGRVLCIADSIDAMCSTRSYRKALGLNYIKQELEKCKNTQFDPALVEIVLGLWPDIEAFYGTSAMDGAGSQSAAEVARVPG